MQDPPRPRIGIGTDVHRLVDGVPLHLAGLSWPDEPQGLEGHSDADVAAHAACDALLSAAGLGSNFGTSDPLGRCVRGRPDRDRRTFGGGVGKSPPGGRRPAATAPRPGRVSATDGAPARRGDDTDWLGLTGRGEGVAAIATAS